MLRRFEIYSLDPAAPQAKVDAMCLAMRRGPHYIPEILHSAIGHNKSDVGLHVVWEHGYESPKAYQRYMIHPFHANIYDRYLLNDCPERIVTDNVYDVGLLGYSCDGPVYWLPNGAARRLVLLRLKGNGKGFRDITAKAKAANPKMLQSVLAENTFATRWLDGETKLFEHTTYTHIWEQGYASLADAKAAGNAWQASADGMVEKFIELWYQLEGGDNYNVGAA